MSCYSLLQHSKPAWLEIFVDHTHTHSMNNLRWQLHWLPRLTSLLRKSRDWWRTWDSLHKIKLIKNQHKFFFSFFFFFFKSQTSDSFVNHFDGHFAYLKTLDFSFKSTSMAVTDPKWDWSWYGPMTWHARIQNIHPVLGNYSVNLHIKAITNNPK